MKKTKKEYVKKLVREKMLVEKNVGWKKMLVEKLLVEICFCWTKIMVEKNCGKKIIGQHFFG